jgi:hypothetical protein
MTAAATMPMAAARIQVRLYKSVISILLKKTQELGKQEKSHYGLD